MIDLNQLSPEQRKALAKEALDAENRAASERAEQRTEYKKIVNETVVDLFCYLEKCSVQIAEFKKKAITDLSTLLSLKLDVFSNPEKIAAQRSHQFSNSDGTITIVMGQNMNDGWDDTVSEGINKVKSFITNLAKDEKTKKLVNTVLRLLSKDDKGNLKASRVLQLEKLAEEYDDPDFNEGVKIIKEAYRPTPSSTYIKVSYKDDQGNTHTLPLSMTTT